MKPVLVSNGWILPLLLGGSTTTKPINQNKVGELHDSWFLFFFFLKCNIVQWGTTGCDKHCLWVVTAPGVKSGGGGDILTWNDPWKSEMNVPFNHFKSKAC